jgi:hypothetical protein
MIPTSCINVLLLMENKILFRKKTRRTVVYIEPVAELHLNVLWIVPFIHVVSISLWLEALETVRMIMKIDCILVIINIL